MKIAACLVVKNESVEIPYWIAWYKALGFDSFIVYNDFSEDNTESVLLSLSDCIDLRYKRNFVNRDRSATRQLRAYNDAIETYKSEFDWIAFFDADEYLDLYGENIHKYLEKFLDFDCVAFNWCCFGTNSFVSRPEGPPPINYTKHGSKNLFWNRHTKVIVRPDRVNGEMYNVHNCNVLGRTAASDGKNISWTNEHGGLTKENPNWIGGRLLHYQSRSLEHYVKRDKNIEDIRRNENDPLHKITKSVEYNEIDSDINKYFLSLFKKEIYDLLCGQINFFLLKLKDTADCSILFLKNFYKERNLEIFKPKRNIKPYDVSSGWISFHETSGMTLSNEEFKIFTLKTHFEKKLTFGNGILCSSDESSDAYFLYIKNTKYVHMFSRNKELISVEGDARIGKFITYEVWQNENGTISLSHPRTGKYLGFKEDGSYVLNKLRALRWESFSIESINYELDDFIKDIINYKNLGIFSLLRDLNKVSGEYFPSAMCLFSPEDRKSIEFLSNNVFGEYIY